MKQSTSTQIGLLRVTNASDYITNGEQYQVFPDKVKVCQINLPQGIEITKREKFLFSIGLTFLSLNEDATEDLVYGYLSSVNNLKKVISQPLSSPTLSKIVSMIFNTKDKHGELEVKPNKERFIIFDDKFNLTTKEKLSIMNKEKGLL